MANKRLQQLYTHLVDRFTYKASLLKSVVDLNYIELEQKVRKQGLGSLTRQELKLFTELKTLDEIIDLTKSLMKYNG